MLNHRNDWPDIDILINHHFLAGRFVHDLGWKGLKNALVDLEFQGFPVVFAIQTFLR